MNILLLGSGGREHAIAYAVSQSPLCSTLFIAPGNGGTSALGQNIALPVDDFEAVGNFAIENNVDMIVVGPEAPLVAGITDYFRSNDKLANIMVLGPDKNGAQLEGSKDYAKQFMFENNIPTARYQTFTRDTIEDGKQFLSTLQAPYVLKADGLAAGKGVLIIDNLDEAQQELQNMLIDAKFGDASKRVVIEEYLSGIELSAFVVTDGSNYVMLPEAKDYKRIGDGDTGLNTGGMGSVSPVAFADTTFMQKVETRIVKPTINGLRKRNIEYHGFIFIGLMAVRNNAGELDPYVIEYNVRMGDPETESVFPRIKSDVVDLFSHACQGTLNQVSLSVDPRAAACVMMVAGGYPEHYNKGNEIIGTEKIQDALLFHCGTKQDANGKLLTSGGRVMCVTSLADTLVDALQHSYQQANLIHWDGKYQRSDIGQDVLKFGK